MHTFNYAALKADNSYIKGQIKSRSRKTAMNKLAEKGVLLINLTRESQSFWEKLATYSTITRLDKIFFTRHLHSFLDAGIALNQAIMMAAEQTTNKKLEEMLKEIYKKINQGQTLSKSLEPYNKYFSNYYIKLIKVGEESGTLDNTLEHLLEQQEREYELLSNIRGALIYPGVVIGAAIAAVIFMMTFVVPTIASVLLEYGGELPLTTKMLIAFSNFIVEYGLLLLPGVILLAMLLRMSVKRQPGKRIFDKILFTLPMIKKIVIEYNNARLMRALCAPLLSGLSINQALELAAGTSNNSYYKQSMVAAQPIIQKGIPLSEVLRGYPELYPPNVVGMIEIGENTGKIDDMMKRLAHFYEQSVFNTFKNISTVIEPFLLLAIGIIIGFVAVSILTPIWKFAETI
jgi:type IV pilus assembly protein PilC